LPTTLGSVELVFGGTYVQERVISIEDPADLDTISRVIYLEYAPPAASARSASGTTDSDGDGIPDVYDAEPSNPDVDFVTSYPADGSFTVAFEDNYPNLGDGDFNDFVVSYNLDIRERGGNLAGISGSATARARAAGYDHEFGILIHIPGFSGKITSYYETPAGVQIVQQQVATGEDVRIVVFPNTKQAFDRPTDRVTADNGYPDKTDSVGYRSTFFVSVDPGVEVSVDDVQAAPFNPYLLAHPTGYDAHLIGQRPLPPPTAEEPDRNTIPSDEDFRDGNGYPWALLVPADVAHPVEGLDVPSGTPIISAAYPRFDSWVSSLGDTDRDWYVDYVAGKVVILP
jgi:LruC domain-containing protein